MMAIPKPRPLRAIFGAGCFWCTEALFQNIRGVISVSPGYAGGTIPSPTYEEVCSGKTGHIEVATILYDPTIVSYTTLLTVFFSSHDPTSQDRQGADQGNQYRSVIFTVTDTQAIEANDVKKHLDTNQTFPRPIVTDIRPYTMVYPAENYHHNYYATHTNEPYCQCVISPKLHHIREQFPALFS